MGTLWSVDGSSVDGGGSLVELGTASVLFKAGIAAVVLFVVESSAGCAFVELELSLFSVEFAGGGGLNSMGKKPEFLGSLRSLSELCRLAFSAEPLSSGVRGPSSAGIRCLGIAILSAVPDVEEPPPISCPRSPDGITHACTFVGAPASNKAATKDLKSSRIFATFSWTKCLEC